VQLAATFNSGLPVTFTSKTPAICSVSGNTMTPLANGLCTVTATQAGNDTYAATIVDKNIPIGTELPAKMTFLTGYKDTDNTNEGLIGHLGNQWWCDSCDRSVSGDHNTYTFTATSDKAPDTWWYSRASFQMFGPGLVDDDLVSVDGYRTGVKDTIFSKPLPAPKGLQLEIQGAMHFNLAQNPEWFGAAAS